MKTVVSMNAQGRLTVPASARQALHLEGAAEFELEVSSDEIILRPAIVIPRTDAWAYTEDHLRRVAGARSEGRQGANRQLSEGDLAALAEERA